MNCGRN